MTILFAQALLAGLIVAIPIGPVPLLCAQRTLRGSRRAGAASALGGTLAHGTCAAFAALGIASLEQWLVAHRILLVLLAGIVLTGIGVMQWRAVRRAAPQEADGEASPSLWRDAASVFSLTAGNPGTLISFGATFAMLGLFVDRSAVAQLAVVTVGALCGASLWWAGLVIVAHKLRERLGPASLVRLQRATGGALTVLGIGAASTTLF